MQTIPKTLDLPKETSEAADAIIELMKKLKALLADGFQPGTDLPEAVIAAVHELGKAMQGMDQIPAEVKENKAAALKVFSLMAAEIVEIVV